MKFAIDVSPLESGHKVRGVGFYLQHLKDALLRYYPEHEYVFFTRQEELIGDIDLVHYPYFDPFFSTLPSKKKYPTVVTVHDLTPLVFPKHFPAGVKGKLRWQIQKYNLKKVDAIITDSQASKKDIIKIAGIPEEKVSVAYLAGGKEFGKRKTENLRPKMREKYNLPEKFVLYVGDVTWNKNVPRLVRAVTGLNSQSSDVSPLKTESGQQNIPLVMVGKALVQEDFDKSNPWNRDLMEVQQLAEGDKNIMRLGFVPTEDLVALYNMATVFVFPSVYEGFGLPILEAMQSGCPVIISKEGCMPEVGGEAAYYFDGYDTESLAKAIQTLFNDEKLQKELSAKGLEQAKKFSWKITTEQTLQVYKKSS